MVYFSYNICKASNVNSVATGPGSLKMRTHLDKICQTGLTKASVEKCWLTASIVTYKLGPVVGFGFSQLRVHSVIPYLRP